MYLLIVALETVEYVATNKDEGVYFCTYSMTNRCKGNRFIDPQPAQLLHATIFVCVGLPQQTSPQFCQKKLDLFSHDANCYSSLLRAGCVSVLFAGNLSLNI